MLAAYMADSRLDPATPDSMQQWRVLYPECGAAKSPRGAGRTAQRDMGDDHAAEQRQGAS